jgi:hypothetical protein
LRHADRLVGTAEDPQKAERTAAVQKVFGLVPETLGGRQST